MNLNYKDENKDLKEKHTRSNAINELQAIFRTPRYTKTLIIPNFAAIMTMVEKNLFRPLITVRNT